MRVPVLRQPTIQAALFLGFVLIAGLWGYTGYEFTMRMAGVEEESAGVTARYLEAQDQLTAIRSQVLIGSVHVRDALLEPDRGLIPRYAAQIDATYRNIETALQAYSPVIDTDAGRAHAERLRQELAEFRTTTALVLQSARDGTARDVRALLNQSLMPRREAAIRLSEEVQALNRAVFVQHQADITEIHREAERRTWQQVGLALLSSLAIAFLFSIYAGRLEKRLMTQMQRNEDNARYLQQLSTRLIGAQEEERRHVARELHDEVGQALTAVQVEVTLAQRRLKTRGEDAELLSEAEAITRGALQVVRDMSQLLHPAVLDDLGLQAAIEWQARTFEGRHGIRVDVQQEAMAPRLPRPLELASYRVVQEALTNVAKHAHAASCRIVLRRVDGNVEITVEDDGQGFDPEREPGVPRGLGLAGMRERVALLDGRVALESARGSGTRVKVYLPIGDYTYV